MRTVFAIKYEKGRREARIHDESDALHERFFVRFYRQGHYVATWGPYCDGESAKTDLSAYLQKENTAGVKIV